MSRTFKDVPQRVIEARNLEAGRIDHDHRERRAFRRLSYWASRELSKTFYKYAQKEINAYRAYLDSLGDEIEYTVEEREGGYTCGTWDAEVGYYTPGEYGYKTVAFIVHRRNPLVEWTAYCTDAEHYDKATDTDTRDGKRVTCTPQWDNPDRPRRGRYRCSCCGDGRNRPGRASVKQALGDLAREANGDGLDEHYSSPLLEEKFGAKKWGTWC